MVNVVTQAMTDAGNAIASDIMDAQISKHMSGLGGSTSWEEWLAHEVPNKDLVSKCVDDEMASVNAIYLAMERERTKSRYYSLFDRQCGGYLHSGRNSKSEEECVDDGIKYMFSTPQEEGDPTIKEALAWSYKKKLGFLDGAELTLECHEEEIEDE